MHLLPSLQVTNPGCGPDHASGHAQGSNTTSHRLINSLFYLRRSTTCVVFASSEKLSVEFLNTFELTRCPPTPFNTNNGSPRNDTVVFGNTLTLYWYRTHSRAKFSGTDCSKADPSSVEAKCSRCHRYSSYSSDSDHPF